MTNEIHIENPNHILTHKELLSLLKEIISTKIQNNKEMLSLLDQPVIKLRVYKMERSDFLKLWNRKGMKEDAFYTFVNYAVEKGMVIWDYMDSICFLSTDFFPAAIKIVRSDIGKIAPWVLPKRKGTGIVEEFKQPQDVI